MTKQSPTLTLLVEISSQLEMILQTLKEMKKQERDYWETWKQKNIIEHYRMRV